jgi:hypothetical protein
VPPSKLVIALPIYGYDYTYVAICTVVAYLQ